MTPESEKWTFNFNPTTFLLFNFVDFFPNETMVTLWRRWCQQMESWTIAKLFITKESLKFMLILFNNRNDASRSLWFRLFYDFSLFSVYKAIFLSLRLVTQLFIIQMALLNNSFAFAQQFNTKKNETFFTLIPRCLLSTFLRWLSIMKRKLSLSLEFMQPSTAVVRKTRALVESNFSILDGWLRVLKVSIFIRLWKFKSLNLIWDYEKWACKWIRLEKVFHGNLLDSRACGVDGFKIEALA